MKVNILLFNVIFLLGCNNFENDIDATLKSNKHVSSSIVSTNDNFIDVRMKVNTTYNILSHIKTMDSSIWISSLNGKSIVQFWCEKHNDVNNKLTYHESYCPSFSFGKGTPMENRINIKNIDELVDNIVKVDSVLKSMPEFPDSNSVFHSFNKNNDEYYYFKFDTKKYSDVTKLYNSLSEDTARFKFCNCK